MELIKTRKWFYFLTLLWVLMLLGLGSWWLYLVFKLHASLAHLNLPELGPNGRFLNMMKWEGSFFFLFLVLLGSSLLYMYLRDLKKTKALGAFFASLTHELRTPLASMRLQAEVIKDLIEDETHSHDQLSDLTKRLIEDTHKLESELEKTLQLSRIEQNAKLNLSPISLERFLKKESQKLPNNISLKLNLATDAKEILADELALSVIFRNLFENTKRHQPQAMRIAIESQKTAHGIEIRYDDFGNPFMGNSHQLGDLFYKFKSKKGSGIGLYLIKNLVKKMSGDFIIENKGRLTFKLIFKNAEGGNE